MAKKRGRRTTAAARRTGVFDPQRLELAQLRRRRQTQRALARETRALTHGAALLDAWIRHMILNLAPRVGLTAFDASEFAALQLRLETAETRVSELQAAAEDRVLAAAGARG